MTLYLRGQRVVLIGHNDERSPLRPGTRGTVMLVDGMGTIHVNWDDGSRLGIALDLGDEIRHLRSDER